MPTENEKNKESKIQESAGILNIMATPNFRDDFATLLRTRWPLFYITTNEEKRLQSFLKHYCIVNAYDCYIWDAFRGLVNLVDGNQDGGADADITISTNILEYILDDSKPLTDEHMDKTDGVINPKIYVLLDFFRFLETRPPDPDIERRLKAIAHLDSTITTIITGPSYVATNVLENLIPVVDFPFPNREELGEALNIVIGGKNVQRKLPGITDKTEEIREDLISSVSGLTIPEAQTAFSKSIVKHKGWNIPTILEEKRQIISKSGILEYYDKTVPINEVGGLKNLVEWIKLRKTCFSKRAKNYGLPTPRGMLTIGMPGCGKSLVCKAISNLWEMPLLRLDFGKLFDSLIGASEQRARDALKLAESIAPVVLWIDEIEKALSGANSGGRTDGGTTMRVLSTFLTWMQENESSVFVVATANNHTVIPGEFLRAGRFDEIFFVDLPNSQERKEIFSVLLKKRNYNPKKFNLELLSSKSGDYSGAEIEKAIDNAMIAGFADNERKIESKDIAGEFKNFKSLFVQKKDDFEVLRQWAAESCVMANAVPENKIDLNLDGAKNIDI
tara:strand:+ start:32233 stop:33912 length:1680 start_codon:yes stop_codon:yes gene_type:complete